MADVSPLIDEINFIFSNMKLFRIKSCCSQISGNRCETLILYKPKIKIAYDLKNQILKLEQTMLSLGTSYFILKFHVILLSCDLKNAMPVVPYDLSSLG